jgi:phospho-N-acetylmuramoyl-pentapeptide-transferase
MTVGIALLVSLIVGPFLIPVLRVLKFGQSIRVDGPKDIWPRREHPRLAG